MYDIAHPTKSAMLKMVVAVPLVLMACAAPLQVRRNIEGAVRDSAGVCAGAGYTVCAVALADHRLQWTETYSDGSYYFDDLRPGKYLVGFSVRSSSHIEFVRTVVYSDVTVHLDHTLGTGEVSADSEFSFSRPLPVSETPDTSSDQR